MIAYDASRWRWDVPFKLEYWVLYSNNVILKNQLMWCFCSSLAFFYWCCRCKIWWEDEKWGGGGEWGGRGGHSRKEGGLHSGINNSFFQNIWWCSVECYTTGGVWGGGGGGADGGGRGWRGHPVPPPTPDLRPGGGDPGQNRAKQETAGQLYFISHSSSFS